MNIFITFYQYQSPNVTCEEDQLLFWTKDKSRRALSPDSSSAAAAPPPRPPPARPAPARPAPPSAATTQPKKEEEPEEDAWTKFKKMTEQVNNFNNIYFFNLFIFLRNLGICVDPKCERATEGIEWD